VGASTPLDEGKALLASFSNVMADHQTRRKLVQQSDKLADTMLREVEAIRPDVVILGSEVLSTQAESRVGAWGRGMRVWAMRGQTLVLRLCFTAPVRLRLSASQQLC
jgi:hypothetical protein